ncbi:nitrate reductase molybdenum cofactor assembly chaperone [Paraoerskovia marina]|uniref:nitrate reductase molybdenum cofactor assembly chaperone n=1 Tax=Paraoerskovia marina TaxID=545619 RepID=UPI000693DFB8|nr:nitrate reductase molybdenum cofactor assembly chaperone [Paraoerskovia marina]
MKTTFLPKPTRRTPQLAPLSPVPATASQRRTTHMAASLLLGYPSPRTPQIVAEVRRAVVGLPDPVAARFTAFCDYTETRDPADLEAEYVRTFDLKRKCSMYLTYFATGDTRKRGTALVRFVEAYKAAGWEIADDELPDYLPAVLELSAKAGDDSPEAAQIAAGLLGSHREGVEVLRSALASMTSPWTGVVEAVCLTLPALDRATEKRFVELVTSGPPTEMVGLSAMGPHESGPSGTLAPFALGGASAEEARR